MSIGAWSAFAGAQQSRVVDLIVSNLFNLCVVVGAVVMFAATDSPVFWLGAALGVAAMIILGWLLRRDISRGRALLATYQAPRMIVLVAVAAAPRPRAGLTTPSGSGLQQGVAILGPLRAHSSLAAGQGDAGGRTAAWLSGSAAATFQSDSFVALTPFATAAVGVLLAAAGAPGWCYLLIVILGTMSVLIITAYAIRA